MIKIIFQVVKREYKLMGKIDDPFDLYSEYKEVPESELTPEKIKEIIDEKKQGKAKCSKKYTV